MNEKEDYLDQLLNAVVSNEPEEDTALKKMAAVQGDEAAVENAGESISGGDPEDEEDAYELDEEENDFPELAAIFEEKKKEPETEEEDPDLSNMEEMMSGADDAGAGAQTEEAAETDEALTAFDDHADLDNLIRDLTQSEEEEEQEEKAGPALAEDTGKPEEAEPAAEGEALPEEEADKRSLDAGTEEMSFEDIEALLNAGSNETESGNSLADSFDDADVTDLLDTMNADGDLGEINDLLKKSDNNMMIDEDDTLSDLLSTMSDNLGSEPEPEEEPQEDRPQADASAAGSLENGEPLSKEEGEGKKKAFGKWKLFGKKKEETEPGEEKEKKPGFLRRLLSLFIDEGDEGLEASDELNQISLSQENIAILESIDKEDPKAKKGKKEKKPKREKKSKEKKAKEPKKKKEKTPKKPKPKKEKKPKEPEPPLRPIGKKRIIVAILFGLTVFGMIMLVTSYIPNFADKQSSVKAFEDGDYGKVYQLLSTRKLKGKTEKIYKGSVLCLQMERQMESYENYKKLNMPVEQLHALILAVGKYQIIEEEAKTYGVEAPTKNTYLNILSILSSEYQISEDEAKELALMEDKVQYTKALKKKLGLDSGMDFSDPEAYQNAEKPTNQKAPESKRLNRNDSDNRL